MELLAAELLRSPVLQLWLLLALLADKPLLPAGAREWLSNREQRRLCVWVGVREEARRRGQRGWGGAYLPLWEKEPLARSLVPSSGRD